MKDNPLHILFVDDEQEILNILKVRFRKEIKSNKLKVSFCQSGQEALDFLDTDNGKDVSILVSDINMPQMSGFKMMEMVNQKFDLKLKYFCSAYDRKDYIDEAMGLGAKRFFKKPMNINEIKSMIESDILELGIEVEMNI